MARQPKLRKKNSYWMTKADGTGTYFGKVALVPHADARRSFIDHLKAAAETVKQRRAAVTVEVLCDLHLAWLKDNRSEDLYKQRQYLSFPSLRSHFLADLAELASHWRMRITPGIR